MFLAGCLHAGKNTNWYLNPVCDFCDPQIPKNLATELPDIKGMDKAIVENYPNPFSSRTNILFILPEDDNVNLEVYDLTGKLLQTLYKGEAVAGQEYNFEFSGSDLPTGIYVYRLTTTGGVFTGKMILNRD
jgi:hypothetical protein